MRIGAAGLALVCCALACGGENEKPDSGRPMDAVVDLDSGAGVDADLPDTGPDDAGPWPDTGVEFFASSCADCDDGCGTGGCLTTQTESFCSDRCDENLDGCIEGFTCFDVGNASFFCIPPAATCLQDGITHGTTCAQDTTGCAPGMTHCEGDFFSFGYCTTACNFDEDCPAGYACGTGDEDARVCRAEYLAPIEQCGRKNDGVNLTCAVDTDCPGRNVCLRGAVSAPGVCAPECPTGDECSDGTTCTETARGLACLADECSCLATVDVDGQRDLLDETLSQVGLSRCDAIYDFASWANVPTDILADPYRLSFLNPIHNEPLRGPAFAQETVDALSAVANGSDGSAARAARILEQLAIVADRPAIRTPPEAVDPTEPLAEAVFDLISASGGNPNRNALVQDAQDVPMDLQLAIAGVIEAMTRAHLARDIAMPSAAVVTRLFDFGPAFVAPRADGRGLDPASGGTDVLLNDQFGYGEMYGAAVDVLDAIDAADLSRFTTIPTTTTATVVQFLFSQDTPIGRIAIDDGESGLYDPAVSGQEGAWALLLDLGGNEDYRVPAGGNSSIANSVSVLLDLGGRDRYGYVEVGHALDEMRLPADAGGRYTPRAGPDEDNGPISLSNVARQGGARMGTAVLIDFGDQDDHYRSLRMSQGSGIFGAGALIDEGGNDIYEAEAVAQGAGTFGLGLLLDLGGDDVRRAYTMSQGFAYARGLGVVIDTAGSDDYLMDPGDPTVGGDPLYFSAQRPGRANSTLGQGFGFGRRADFTDRAFMSGGLGILLDEEGDDRYSGSIFAQAGGFWFGSGILADRAGADQYDALWYGMATGAHFALGFLLDGAGDDRYGTNLPRVNVTIAGGHDYSAVFLIDESGNDQYFGSRISLGCGNVNGMGIFVDNGGDDIYDVRNEYAVGNAGLLENDAPGSARRKVKTLGVFIDADGTDTYALEGVPLEAVGDMRTWTQSRNAEPAVNEVELGSGVDGTGESTLHFR